MFISCQQKLLLLDFMEYFKLKHLIWRKVQKFLKKFLTVFWVRGSLSFKSSTKIKK